MFRTAKWVALASLMAGLVYTCGCVFGWMGCGFAELELELQVLDTETGLPIAGAEIEITSWDGFPEEVHDQQTKPLTVVLQTDETGVILIRAGRRFADMTGNAWETNDYVYAPHWRYEVSAPGYATTYPTHGYHGTGVHFPQLRTDHGTVKQIVQWRLVPEQ